MPRLRTSTALKIAYAGLAATDTWLSGRSGPSAHRARFVTKPLLMPTLAASLLTDDRAAGSPLRTNALIAQTGGWGGDVALLGEGTGPFLAGAGSFAVGHVAYLTGFIRQRSLAPVMTNPKARGVAVVWALTAAPVAVLAGRQHREFGVPVLGYATMLATMTARATHLDPRLSLTSRRMTAIGAGLFMVSDTLLAIRKFVLTDPPAGLETAVMSTYAAGQFLLSEGAVRA